MRGINVFNARNQDTSYDTALTSDAMNAKNTNIQSWTALTKYHFKACQHNITRCTETLTPGQALDTTEKIQEGETGTDHSLGIADITALAVMTCTEATPNHNKGMGTATIEAAQGNPIQHTEATIAEPTVTCLTGHTPDHWYTTAHQVTILRTTVDHVCTHPTDQQNIIPITEAHTVQDQEKNQNL